MAESTIPVDLHNPGQVFACLGMLEAAELLLGDAAGVFAWEGAEETFRVAACGKEEPVARVLRFLEDATVIARAPDGSKNYEKWLPAWGDTEFDRLGAPFPFPDPDSLAMLPAVLRDVAGAEIVVDYWGDATRRDNVKFWAGSRGYPGAAILRDALELVRGRLPEHESAPFALSAGQSSSFRFDWRRDYVPIDAGFSLNNHKSGRSGIPIVPVGFPLVEILAAVGMTHARPARIDKLEYHYGVIGGDRLLDPLILRAALGAESPPVPGLPFRRFCMHLDWPGKAGQARCITRVTEEEP